jgi:hypothetical protein
MSSRDHSLPALPCPECRFKGHGGDARIGNRRRTCTTCNRFSQSVLRMTRSRLIEQYEDEYRQIRLKVEADLYPQVIEQFLLSKGVIPGHDDVTVEDLDV